MRPIGRCQVGIDPSQPAARCTECALAECKHHRIHVDRDRLRGGEPGQHPLADRPRPGAEAAFPSKATAVTTRHLGIARVESEGMTEMRAEDKVVGDTRSWS